MTKFFTIDQIMVIHDDFLKEHGGLSGIRDIGLLESAIEMPKATMFGEYLHKTIYDKAAAYLFHIVQNHPFNDGNKRTGSLTAVMFLFSNGVEVNINQYDYINFVVEVAKGKKDKGQIAQYFENNPAL